MIVLAILFPIGFACFITLIVQPLRALEEKRDQFAALFTARNSAEGISSLIERAMFDPAPTGRPSFEAVADQAILLELLHLSPYWHRLEWNEHRRWLQRSTVLGFDFFTRLKWIAAVGLVGMLAFMANQVHEDGLEAALDVLDYLPWFAAVLAATVGAMRINRSNHAAIRAMIATAGEDTWRAINTDSSRETLRRSLNEFYGTNHD